MAECGAKGASATPCAGPPSRRCGLCGAVAYCSAAHQRAHWKYHKEECGRLEEQMKRVGALQDFPFTFSEEATLQNTRCCFLMNMGLHQIGLWKYECTCGSSSLASVSETRVYNNWDLPSTLCPCREPTRSSQFRLSSWKAFYEWRCLPLSSPAGLLLHWPLTVYRAYQLTEDKRQKSEVDNVLSVHYLGPEKELLQLAVFGELLALLPGVNVHIELIGPAVPHFRDGEIITLRSYMNCVEAGCKCKSLSDKKPQITLRLWKGCYHDRKKDIDTSPHLIVAPNAGVAAECSWLPTVELLEKMDLPAIFSDYCEEAAYIAAQCISSITGRPLRVPIQLNPFRQPIAVEGSALYLPCYSNCFLFGM